MIRKIAEPTEWVNSMVVVEKPSGGQKICLDPRDLKKTIKRGYYQHATFEKIASRLSGAKPFMKLDANKGYWQTPLDKESISGYTHSGFQFLAYVSLICFLVFYLPGISNITRCKTF